MKPKRQSAAQRPPAKAVHCAVYTRKSTEEGLDQDFNSLDAQRESGEAYIASQRCEGWACLPERYDDGGFTGGNMDRPALARLLADIEAGRIDCVVVYKVDRLSRSLLDFAKMMEVFEKHKVAFVSVTQQFNTASSMGRLVLNVLLSFAQFEREIIGERTRDKIAAARRKGKWAGGHLLLGYDLDPKGRRLVVNEGEAARVRSIFGLYLEQESLLPTVKELAVRGWTGKRWVNRRGKERGGRPFTRTRLHKLLTNVAYLGKVRHKGATYDGEHPAIVEPAVWQRVQAMLDRNRRTGGAPARNGYGALLKGVLRCVPCGCAMAPTHTTRGGNKRYRYYVCSGAQARGWHTCPSKSLPASEIERFVVERLRSVAADPAVLHKTVAQANRQSRADTAESEAERRTLARELARLWAEVRRIGTEPDKPATGAKAAELNERIGAAERRAAEVATRLAELERAAVDEADVAAALAAFEPVWESLSPREQARVVALLVERVDYDGGAGRVSVTFRPAGIKTLAGEAREAANGTADGGRGRQSA